MRYHYTGVVNDKILWSINNNNIRYMYCSILEKCTIQFYHTKTTVLYIKLNLTIGKNFKSLKLYTVYYI